MRGAALAGLLCLAACSEGPPPEQVRLCRAVIGALHPEHTVLLGQRPSQAAGGAIRIDYMAEEPGRVRGTHYLVCRFGEGAKLEGLETERGPVSDVKFIIIRRWWPIGPDAMAGQAMR